MILISLTSYVIFRKGGEMSVFQKWLLIFTAFGVNCFSSAGAWANEFRFDLPELTMEASSAGSSPGAQAAGSFFELVASILFLGLIHGDNLDEEMSISERHHKKSSQYFSHLPTFRLEGAYQKNMNNQKPQGFNGNLTVGYMPIAADIDVMHLYEGASLPNRTILAAHGLLRSVFFYFMEIDLALGAKTIDAGSRQTGFEVGLPLYFFIGKHVILDAKSYLSFLDGTNVVDFSSGLSFRYKWAGIRGAYRYLDLGNEQMHALQSGLFFHW